MENETEIISAKDWSETESKNLAEKQATFKSTIESYDKDEHSIIFVISDGSVDHDNEIVNPAGMFFRKQPKGLYDHNYHIPAVTRLEWVKYIDPFIKAKFVFDQNDPFSVLLENKYVNKFMTDCSIGFKFDRSSLSVNADGILVYNKWELTEVSLCNLGANLNAVSLSMDECEMLTKSKTYQTNTIIKTEVDTLRYRVMVKTLKDEIFAEIDKKFELIKPVSVPDDTIKAWKEDFEKKFGEYETKMENIEKTITQKPVVKTAAELPFDQAIGIFKQELNEMVKKNGIKLQK
jgi:hypothetical protein